MEPTGIVLENEYSLGPDLEEKTAHWGEMLWKLLRRELTVEIPRGLKNREQFEFISQRLVNYMLTRLVIQGVRLFQENKDLDEETIEGKLADLVDDLFDFSETTRGDIVSYLVRICPRLNTNNGSKPTESQNAKMRAFARERGHRCYICGQQLKYQSDTVPDSESELERKDREKRYFEADHIFPMSRGGGRGADNLAACCNACNKLKDVNIGFADFMIETAITKSFKPKNIIDHVANSKMRFALLWKQKGTCPMCNEKFYNKDKEKLFLTRKNNGDCYHFLNSEIVCDPCNELYDLDGVLIRE